MDTLEIPEPRGHVVKYPWDTLEIGESFLVPENVKKGFTAQVSAANRKFKDKRFVTRIQDGVMRVWRVK